MKKCEDCGAPVDEDGDAIFSLLCDYDGYKSAGCYTTNHCDTCGSFICDGNCSSNGD